MIYLVIIRHFENHALSWEVNQYSIDLANARILAKNATRFLSAGCYTKAVVRVIG